MTIVSGAEGVDVDVVGAQPKISVGGAAFTDEETSSILGVDVESVVGRPDLCEIRLLQKMDGSATPADDISSAWMPGKELKVEWGGKVVFTGEVTSVDFTGGTSSPTEIVLLAFDKRHRMYRTEQVKVFKNASYKDVIADLLGEISVQHDLSGLPTDVMKYYLHEGTVGDLLERLCDQYGLYCLSKEGKVLVKKSSELTDDAGVVLRASAELLDFRFRQTTSADRAKAQVRGWDPKQKKEIVGDGARSAALPSGGLVASLDSQQGFGEQTLRHTTFVSSENEAKARALGALTRNVDAGIQLDGSALFSPKLTAGSIVKVEGVPQRFTGKYRLTSVRHQYDLADGGRSVIVCRGADDTTLTGLLEQAVLGGAAGARSAGHGLQPAIVVNVKSAPGEGALGAEGAAGEVKVKLPWLGDDIESGWLRVLTVGGGKDRGFFVMPEKDDEVLVAFHDGDMRSGYVLGGLYNGKDAAPRSAGDLTDGAVIQERVWKSRAGHEIVMGDKDGEEFILIKSSDEKYQMVFDVKDQAIRIASAGDVTITAEKDLFLESQGEMTIKAAKDLKLEGQNVKIDGMQNVDVKAGANATVEGTAGAAVKGGKVDVNASGIATVKGSTIMLN